MPSRCVGRLILAWGLAAFIAGCGSRGDRDPHQLADATVVKPTDPVIDPANLPQPTMQVVEPKAGARFPIGDGRKIEGGIRCVVRLEVPTGGKTPEIVIAQLLSRGVNAGSAAMKPKEKSGDNVWILEGDLELPRSKGTYKLRAEGIQTLIVAESLEKKPPPDAFKTTRLHSPDVEIKVGDQ